MADQPDSPTDGVIYEHSADDIHRFTFYDDSKQTLDRMIQKLEEVYAALDSSKTHIKLYIDLIPTRNGPPMRAIASKFQPFFQQFPDRPAGSLAIITQRGSVFTMLASFLNLFSRNKDRFRIFREGEEGKVIAWLLEGD